MSTEDGRALKLVKGGAPANGRAAAAPTRSARRRAAIRRTPRRHDPIRDPIRDPITEILERLDEEPVKDDAPRRKRSRRRPQWTTVALAVALCAAVVAAVLLGGRWYGDRRLDKAHQQAVAAARQTTVNFVSVSAASVDRDPQRIAAGATGGFKDEVPRGQSQ